MEEYIKDFDGWNNEVKVLESKKFEDFFYAREIWWCALGVNIGSEQDGKNDSFERPVLILKKINSNLLLMVPLTSKISAREYRVTASILGKKSQILIEQARTISSKRLLRKIGSLKKSTFQEVIICFLKYILSFQEGETPP